MKFCTTHWDALTAELARVGLGKFIAEDGAEAIQKTAASIENTQQGVSDSAAQFEPLMAAHWAIVNNAMRLTGLALMLQNEDGTDRCPLCFITVDHKANCHMPGCTIENYDEWIVRAVEDQVVIAKELGLLGEA